MRIRKVKLNRAHSLFDWHRRRNEKTFLVATRRWRIFLRKRISAGLVQFKKDQTDDILDWGRLSEDGQAYFKPVIVNTYVAGSNIAYGLMGLDPKTFDVLNVEAVKIADRICAKLVTDVTNETKIAIRQRVREGIRAGKSMSQVAKELRYFIGLNTKQSTQLSTYRLELLTKHPDMKLSVLNRKVRTFSEKLHRQRLEMIARTETARAQNFGYVKTLDKLGVKEFEFSCYIGCCKQFCIDLSGQVYPAKDAYTVIPVHPNCRCAMLPVIE